MAEEYVDFGMMMFEYSIIEKDLVKNSPLGMVFVSRETWGRMKIL